MKFLCIRPKGRIILWSGSSFCQFVRPSVSYLCPDHTCVTNKGFVKLLVIIFPTLKRNVAHFFQVRSLKVEVPWGKRTNRCPDSYSMIFELAMYWHNMSNKVDFQNLLKVRPWFVENMWNITGLINLHVQSHNFIKASWLHYSWVKDWDFF